MIPDRIALAVELLDPDPSDAVLEIGCGRGVAAALIAARLVTGSLTAIDRSGTAVAAASAANSSALEEGRATFLKCAFEELELVGRSFDRVLAVNVSRFWQDAANEAGVWRSILKPGSRIVLVFEPPPGASTDREVAGSYRYLEANGFTEIRHTKAGRRAAGVLASWPVAG